MKLLTTENAKTTHGEELGYLTGILYLDPRASDKLCPFASVGCKALCLVDSGMAEAFPKIMKARTRKTQWYLTDKESFVAQLIKDIKALIKRAAKLGLKPAVRLNGTSDILFERLIDFDEFPDVQFYDYTKVPLEYRRPSHNYHLTFSFSGTNREACFEALNASFNVAMVFAGEIPATYNGYKVIDGTTHDLRFLDESGVIVGLCIKGRRAKKQAKQSNGFIITEY